MAPFVQLALCVSFLYRVRRIDPDGDLGAEPWMVLMAHGWVERIGAAAWAVVTALAVVGVAAATLVYECGGVWTPGEGSEGQVPEPAPFGRGFGRVVCGWSLTGLALEAAALGALAWAWARALRVARWGSSASRGRADG